MELCQRSSKGFYPILARLGLCNSFCSHLLPPVGKRKRRALQSSGDCLQRSTKFTHPCHIRCLGCPITSVLDRSAAGAWEEDEVEVAVSEEAVGHEAEGEGEGGNCWTHG